MTRAGELHDAFDRSFAAALPPPAPAHSDFLCIRVSGERFALALAELASLHADLRIAALPSRAPELLGVAAIRAAIVPIYDLALALGGSAAPAARFIALVRGGAAGFAFDGFEGHARIADQAFAAASQRGHARGQFALAGQPRTVLDLSSLVTAIETRWRQRGAEKAG